MNKCKLENHNGVTPRYSEILLFCPLFKAEKTVGMICAHHCLRVGQVVDVLNRLMIMKDVTKEDLKLDPTCFYRYLPNELKTLAEDVCRESGIDWQVIQGECSRCPAPLVEPREIPKVEPTEMKQVGRDGLR